MYCINQKKVCICCRKHDFLACMPRILKTSELVDKIFMQQSHWPCSKVKQIEFWDF
jgi:hypothetical protein